ncbi:MAG: hypothetical protein ABSF70_14350 [Terracidiphilus sp.]|jgi:hypothetical protein
MEISLRPLTLGEILDRTAQLYRSNFLLFAGIFVPYSAALLVLGLVQIGMSELFKGQHKFAGVPVWTLVFSLVVTWPVIVLMLGVSTAAISRAVAWVHLGEPATIRGAYSSILPRMGRYLWLMAITYFRIWMPLVVLYLCLFGVLGYFGIFNALNGDPSATSQPAFANNPQAAIVALGVMAILGLLMIPAFIYALLMTLRYSLAVPACVVENLKARTAIRRSIELARGSWGRIFLLMLLVGVIKLGLGAFTQFFILIGAFKHPGQLPSPGVQALSQVIGFFTNTFLGPIWATGITLFYYDQRIRKEGYDIEWMMHAAGLTVPERVTPPAPSSEPWRDSDAQVERPPSAPQDPPLISRNDNE